MVQSLGLYGAIGNLVDKLDSIRRVVDGFAQLHPLASAAWAVASALYLVITNQIRTDQAVVNLAGKLSESLDFALDADMLRERLRSIENTVARLFNQITECCLFIREYTGKGFVARMFRLGDQRKIGAFIQSLAETKLAIDQGVNIHAAIVTIRVAAQVNQLYLRTLLQPDITDVYGRRSCLEGTRTSVLRDITGWLLTESSQNILWLYGTAGSGKSTIARSIQDYMLSLSRLGAYVCFERGKSTPNGVIRTLAYQLASYDSQIAESVIAALADSDINVTPIRNQFEVLHARPLSATTVTIPGPVVIVLDALDECGDAISRKELLRVLEGFTRLPSNFRFLITGRPEADLHKAFTTSTWSRHVRPFEVDCNSDETRKNVLDYLHDELRELSEPYEDSELQPIWERNIGMLAEAASGLFISASTAVRMIEASDNPFVTLKELVSGDTRLSQLDELYTTVLQSSGIQWEKPASVSRFRDIVSFMILRKAPLSDSIIDGILGLPLECSSRFMLEKLRPLVGYERGEPIYFRHTTISDYFLTSCRKNYPWSIDIDPQHYFFAGRCFSTMEESLRFNIAGLDSSYARNDSIPGLEQTILSNISPSLQYSSLYWAKHLGDCESARGASLLDALSDFLKKRLLYWLEVLSLLKFKGTDKILCDAGRWLSSSSDLDTTRFLKDARKLLNTFHEPISESIPHIYLSMLPLMRFESITAEHYSRHLSHHGLTVTRHGARKASRQLKTLEANGVRFVHTTAFSSVDGTQLVSGSDDGSIRVWDIESGELTYMPATKHDSPVSSLVLTSDGKRVISGGRDSSVKLWNLDDHSEETLGQHEAPVLSIAISRDDAMIATGSEDGAVKIWHLGQKTDESLACPNHILSVLSVAFRPGVDSNWLASSSLDGSLRMWNVADGQSKDFTLAEDESWVQTVAFNLDGSCLICGSDNGQIRIRGVDDGAVLRILSGHSGAIHSLHVSSITGQLLSGSQDRTLRVWDITTGAMVCEPIVGDGHVSSAVWSCDGQHIASASGGLITLYDTAIAVSESPYNTSANPIAIDSPLSAAIIASDNSWIAAGSTNGVVRIWRRASDGTWGSPKCRSGHRDHIWSAAKSPDERRFATGSADSVRIWSLERGSLVVEPLVIKVEFAVRSVAFSPLPGSRDLAVATLIGVAMIWDSETGKLVRSFGKFPFHCTSVAYSPDASMLAAGYWDGVVRCWDVNTGDIIQSLDPHSSSPDPILSLAFSCDGKIATGTQRESVRIWDSKSGTLLIDLPHVHTNQVFSVAFSPDGKYLVSGCWDNAIKLWDADTGESLMTSPRGHTKRVYSLVFSSDGSSIVSSSGDATIKIWDRAKFSSPAPVLREDGWLVDEQGRLFMWIPPSLRASLLWDAAQLDVVGLPFATRLEFPDRFGGDGWRRTWTL
ncbi:WD40-repeat-containing domain protein [Irpex rosettiformis]|uniref:WD40-repeat-containing domain protein n=1 Tax=Irpex rosettiformis TaxID=378272 RepID=A0ACB8U9Q8_9APHY|nr:WD40-repeat-containing domain protein [Irpex rosettiformis]